MLFMFHFSSIGHCFYENILQADVKSVYSVWLSRMRIIVLFISKIRKEREFGFSLFFFFFSLLFVISSNTIYFNHLNNKEEKRDILFTLSIGCDDNKSENFSNLDLLWLFSSTLLQFSISIFALVLFVSFRFYIRILSF